MSDERCRCPNPNEEEHLQALLIPGEEDSEEHALSERPKPKFAGAENRNIFRGSSAITLTLPQLPGTTPLPLILQDLNSGMIIGPAVFKGIQEICPLLCRALGAKE